MPNSVVALFCDDVRFEQSGQYTLVGVLPDNIAVPHLPIALPRFGIFLRAQIETAKAPEEFHISLQNTDGTEYESMPQWNKEIVQKGQADAEKNRSPIFGLIGTLSVAPFRISAPGHIICSVTIDGAVYIAGLLNVILAKPTASEQPALQSPSAS